MTTLPDGPDWTGALCTQTDPELFFPEKGGTALHAKRICNRCPLIDQCLQVALANNEEHGVWGGLSRDERWALTKTRRRTAA